MLADVPGPRDRWKIKNVLHFLLEFVGKRLENIFWEKKNFAVQKQFIEDKRSSL